MKAREVSLLPIRLDGDGPPGAPRRLVLPVVLKYLDREPVAFVELTEDQALRLAEQAIAAVRIVQLSGR